LLKTIFIVRGRPSGNDNYVDYEKDYSGAKAQRIIRICYGVLTERLNEQAGCNADPFPLDFAFFPRDWEVTNLKSQIATSSL
jgi:hypothetical protein